MSKAGNIVLLALLFVVVENAAAQVQKTDTGTIFMADSLKAVYIYADTGNALNRRDDQGRRQGLWQKIYPDGHIRYVGHFWDDKPTGVFKNYYDEGDSLEAIRIYSDDGQSAYAHLFYFTGALMAEGKYVGEKEDSIWKFYNDIQQLVRKSQYKDGKLEGKSVIFYPDGNAMEIKNWKDSLEEGPFQQYFDEGGLKEEGTYVHGELQDTLYVYHPDGKISVKGTYVNDMHEGKWIYYYDGAPTDTLVYHRGQCLNCYKYAPTKRQEDSLKLHYQQLQQQLDNPSNLEEGYRMPEGE